MPPSLDLFRRLRKCYWTHDPDLHARLVAASRAVGNDLLWKERLRLLHLTICAWTADRSPTLAREVALAAAPLATPASPYAPRRGCLFVAGLDDRRPMRAAPPGIGLLANRSDALAGCVEAIRARRDTGSAPAFNLDFIPFREIRALLLAPPAEFREAKVYWRDGGEEIVFLPGSYPFGSETARATVVDFLPSPRSAAEENRSPAPPPPPGAPPGAPPPPGGGSLCVGLAGPQMILNTAGGLAVERALDHVVEINFAEPPPRDVTILRAARRRTGKVERRGGADRWGA
ncbi:MAG: hypothetical protein HY719_10825 [Planctomycetes bacterium]|nr:hypothetical protein [Planctomycetota bacterium]